MKINKIDQQNLKQLQKQTQYYLVLAILLLAGGLQKQGDNRKQATKLAKKNFREAEGITQRDIDNYN